MNQRRFLSTVFLLVLIAVPTTRASIGQEKKTACSTAHEARVAGGCAWAGTLEIAAVRVNRKDIQANEDTRFCLIEDN